MSIAAITTSSSFVIVSNSNFDTSSSMFALSSAVAQFEVRNTSNNSLLERFSNRITQLNNNNNNNQNTSALFS